MDCLTTLTDSLRSFDCDSCIFFSSFRIAVAFSRFDCRSASAPLSSVTSAERERISESLKLMPATSRAMSSLFWATSSFLPSKLALHCCTSASSSFCCVCKTTAMSLTTFFTSLPLCRSASADRYASEPALEDLALFEEACTKAGGSALEVSPEPNDCQDGELGWAMAETLGLIVSMTLCVKNPRASAIESFSAFLSAFRAFQAFSFASQCALVPSIRFSTRGIFFSERLRSRLTSSRSTRAWVNCSFLPDFSCARDWSCCRFVCTSAPESSSWIFCESMSLVLVSPSVFLSCFMMPST
mmetsp:Transcript_8411/g.22847  ORF Transcript_8411/g.22847 Transcript_8411/m.22847 type:complete len:299 (-) Transcript_8411:659-1555(-)